MRRKATKEDIGLELYPVDNSYSQDLRTGEYPTVNNKWALAGSSWTPAVKVKILSEPIFLTLPNALGKNEVREMVIVEYEGNKFIVFNIFSTTMPHFHLDPKDLDFNFKIDIHLDFDDHG